MARVIVNKKSVSKKLINAVNNNKRFSLKKHLNKRLDNRVDKLIGSIISHPISRELSGGPKSRGGILPYGNLFSFLGFNSDDRPVEDLTNLIKNNTRITKAKATSINQKGVLNIETAIYVPTLNLIEKRTVLPWDGKRSWLRGLEVTGYDNFAHYLYSERRKFKRSRSGPAIQIRQKLRDIQSLSPQPYVLSEIEKFIKNLNKR